MDRAVSVRLHPVLPKDSGATRRHHRRSEDDTINSLSVIAPYKYDGMWVFDDPRVGLIEEPFGAGADTIIDAMVEGIPDAERGFRMVFAAGPFPGYQHKPEWVRPEMSGNVYRWACSGFEVWFCPLIRYVAEAPRSMYLKVEPNS